MAKGVSQFFKEVKQEGRKVTWPTRKEVIIMTIIVMIMVSILAVFLTAADWVIASIIRDILGLGE